MSKSDHERLRQILALADDQMGDAERKELEPGLTDDERQLIDEERRLVEVTRKAVGGEGPSDALWTKLQSQMKETSDSPKPTPAPAIERRSFWRIAPAIAAGLLMAVGMVWMLASTGTDGFEAALQSRAALKPSDLEANATIGADRKAVEAWLKREGYDLDLARLDPLVAGAKVDGHDVRFLGVAPVKLGQENAAGLLFNCCGESVQVLLLRRGTDAAKQVTALADTLTKLHMRSRTLGDTVAVTLGHHDGRGMVDLLAERKTG